MMDDDKKIKLNRRDFLKLSTTAGSGLLISIYLSGCQDETIVHNAMPTGAETDTPRLMAAEEVINATATPEPEFEIQPNVFIKIDSNGLVTITAAKPELGQGVRTALPMIVAEELEVDWSSIQLVQANAGQEYFDQSVGGSDSISGMYLPMRRAGAVVRGLLIAAAAKIWDVDPASCVARSGHIVHQPSGEQLPYGQLLSTAAEMPLPSPELKSESDFHLIGTPAMRKDNLDIANGSATYASDVVIPNLLYAVVARPPRSGSRIDGFDDSATLAIPGVRHVVQFGNKIAVVAEHTWQALKGRAALKINWRSGSEESFSAPMDQTGAQKKANSLVASYTVPHFAHVTMEPMTCTADVQENATIVWAPTQSPLDARNAVLSVISGTPAEENIEVRIPLIGGGFGRRINVDYVDEAVRISQAIKLPVKVFWTREDDIRHDYLHPCGTIQVEAPLDTPAMPRLRRTDHASPAQTGAWRAVGQNDNAFARESFIDEYAEVLGIDPVSLRKQIYPEPLLINAMDKVVEISGWGSTLPEGRAHGLACFSTWNATHVAEVVEVSIENNRRIRVHKVFCAVDCGIVINPNMVKEQMEGGIVFALSAALGNEITFRDGQIEQSNFDDFPILRIGEMPNIEVHILENSRPPQGVGEMSGPPVLAAVANAVFALTGKRLRQIPFRLVD